MPGYFAGGYVRILEKSKSNVMRARCSRLHTSMMRSPVDRPGLVGPPSEHHVRLLRTSSPMTARDSRRS
jgi:hypothetical protein